MPERSPDDPRPSPGSFGSDPEAKPIKGFVAARTKSVDDQLAGRSEGLDDGYMAAEKEPSNRKWVARLFISEMDQDGDEKLSGQEFRGGFESWFSQWKQEDGEALSEKDVKLGLNRALSAMQMADKGS